jgi:hypothetical protein
MRRFCLLLLAIACAIAAPAAAQVQSGTVSGTIEDQQGGLLPGATVTLAGSDRTLTFVTGEDGRYRFLNVPPGTYKVSAELSGFSTLVRDNVVVVVGATVDLPFVMRVATVQETVTVEGSSPIVDARATGTATNFTQDELSKIPTSRDPWALLRTVPGVQMDRVNIAGNETGQQSNFASKGASRYDTVWTLDGVVITDMSANGGSPSYFDFDAFQEIQISTSGQDIRQPTGGAGLNFVVKRGTNQYRGTARGYFTNDGLEGSNVPDELLALGVTPETADHNDQISDYGFDLGGPIVRDRAWVWGSWTQQDIRLIRSAGALRDRTILKTYNVKGNWQATNKDMVTVLWFLGDKLKYGRGTGDAQVLAPTATWNQGNAYPENRPHGLLKFENNHVFSSNLFLSSKYAYYGTGFSLEPAGGLDGQASVSTRLGQAFGTTRALRFLRPQHILNFDANHFRSGWGGNHDLKFGMGWRRHDATTQTIWPGNMIQAQDFSDSQVARIYREGLGTNRNEYLSFYVGDTLSRGRLTLDAGLRFDRQTGSALPSSTRANAEFPNLVPGIDFGGYDAPFSWNTLHPRIGLTWALDDSRRTLLRANFSRYAGQLDANTVGFANLSGNAGYVDYPWEDRNGDLFVQRDEVLLSRGFIAPGGGFNPDNPTSVVSADSLDPDLEAPLTTGVVVGVEREVMPNLAVSANYTWSRSSNYVGLTGAADPLGLMFIPWRGLTANDYDQIGTLTGTLPDGQGYSVPIFAPDAALVAANGNGRELTNYDGYYTTYNGLELSIVKRMSNRWMMRGAFAWNNPREHYDAGARNLLGNPTRYESSSLVDGGIAAQRSAGSGSGDVFVNGKWQINVNGAYDLGRGFEVAGNFFGRQGNPYPIFQSATLGLDGNLRVLVSPELDTFRFDDLWNLDLRGSKTLSYDRFNVQLIADLFNVFNANTELNRQRNITQMSATSFGRLTQNLSPRILRFGVRVGF